MSTLLLEHCYFGQQGLCVVNQSIESVTGQKSHQDGGEIYCVDELWPLNKCRQGCRFHYTLLKRTGSRVQRDMIGSEDYPGAPGLPEVIGAEAEEASHLVCIKHLRLDLFPRCTGLRLCLPCKGSVSPFAVVGNNTEITLWISRPSGFRLEL